MRIICLEKVSENKKLLKYFSSLIANARRQGKWVLNQGGLVANDQVLIGTSAEESAQVPV
jgi:hypothetical protein